MFVFHLIHVISEITLAKTQLMQYVIGLKYFPGWPLVLYVQEVVTRAKILNRTILSNRIHVIQNYFAL